MSDHKSNAARLVIYWEGINHPVIRELVDELRSSLDVNRDLLEALKEVLKHEKWHAAIADEVTPSARAAIKQAEAAIAKATGNN